MPPVVVPPVVAPPVAVCPHGGVAGTPLPLRTTVSPRPTLRLAPLLLALALLPACGFGYVSVELPRGHDGAGQPLEPGHLIERGGVVHVDRVGYATAGEKWALVVADPPATRFSVLRVDTARQVLAGRPGEPVLDADSGDRVQAIDLSPITEPGRYEIRVRADGSGEYSVHLASARFRVAEHPYRPLLRQAVRSYYGQRCGIAVDLGPEHPGYRHAACHLQSGWHPSSGRSGEAAITGGWHDAGDYGRYVVNSGITVGTLLLAWELYEAPLAALDLAIPESGDAVPDVLDEVRWNLEWMLAMQDADGGAWHKQTPEEFPAFVRPEDDAGDQLVIGTGAAPWKSSCATADLAAVAAQAARVYRPHDPAFAARAEAASVRAWNWLHEHPDDVVFENPPGVVTGEYGDADCSDERLWAAAELWRAARHDGARDYLVDHDDQLLAAIGATSPPSWSDVTPLAAWSLALDGTRPEAAPDPELDPELGADLATALRRRAAEAADAIAVRVEAHPYRIPHTAADWVWGSNAVAANYAVDLLVATRLAEAAGETPDPAWTEAARDVAHYLLGRNPFSVSWVTGSGHGSFRHPHHRPSGSDGLAAPWPGLLAGGPNAHPQDPALAGLPTDTPAARSWLDVETSYASNEVAINWNAPWVFLLAGLESY